MILKYFKKFMMLYFTNQCLNYYYYNPYYYCFFYMFNMKIHYHDRNSFKEKNEFKI